MFFPIYQKISVLSLRGTSIEFLIIKTIYNSKVKIFFTERDNDIYRENIMNDVQQYSPRTK